MPVAGSVDLVIRIKSHGDSSVRRLERDIRGAFQRIAAEGRKTSTGLKHAFDTLQIRPLKEVNRDIERLQAAFNRLKRSGTLSSAELYRANRALKAQIAALKGETSAWADAMGRAKAGLLGMAAAGYSVIKVFGAYETYAKRMAEVFTLVDVSREQFAQFSKAIVDMSTRVPQSAEELAAAEYDIISAGVQLSKSMQVLELSSKAAVAGVTDTKTAVRAGLGVLNAYSMRVENLGHVYDVLFETVRRGVTTFPELSQYLGEVLPVATAAGVKFESLAASIAVLTKSGMRTPIAMTALMGAIRSLSVPTPEAEKAFKRLGITWKGLIPTLEELKKRSLDLHQLRDLVPDVRALNGVITLINHLDELKRVMGEMERAAGTMQAAYQKVADTPASKVKMFKNQIEAIKISLGAFYSEALLPAAKTIGWFAAGLTRADAATKAMVVAVTHAAGAMLLWKLGLGNLVAGLHGLAIAAGEATAALGALGPALAAITVTYSVVEIGRLVKAIYELRSALKSLHEQADKEKQQAQEYKHAADIRIKSKQELSQMSAKEREEYAKNLQAAIKYYTHLANAADLMSSDAVLGGLLPLQSAKGKENERKAKEYAQTINKLIRALADLRRVGSQAKPIEIAPGESAEQIQKQLEAEKQRYQQIIQLKHQALQAEITVTQKTIASMNARRTSLREALDEARRLWQQYVDAVKREQDAIVNVTETAAEMIRRIRRRTMTQAQLEADKEKEYREKLTKAEIALYKKNYKEAIKYASQAREVAASLEDQRKAINGVKDSSSVLKRAHEELKQAAEQAAEAQEQQMNKLESTVETLDQSISQAKAKLVELKSQLDEMTSQPSLAKIEVESKLAEQKIAELQDKLNRLTQSPYKVRIEVTQTESHNTGGLVGVRFASGGQVPGGWGSRDTVPALLTPGEYVHPVAAVKYYGVEVMRAIRDRLIPPELLRNYKKSIPVPSLPSAAVRKFEIKLGDATLSGWSDVQILDAFEQRLRRMRLCGGTA